MESAGYEPEVSRSMLVDPTSKTPYSDATQVILISAEKYIFNDNYVVETLSF